MRLNAWVLLTVLGAGCYQDYPSPTISLASIPNPQLSVVSHRASLQDGGTGASFDVTITYEGTYENCGTVKGLAGTFQGVPLPLVNEGENTLGNEMFAQCTEPSLGGALAGSSDDGGMLTITDGVTTWTQTLPSLVPPDLNVSDAGVLARSQGIVLTGEKMPGDAAINWAYVNLVSAAEPHQVFALVSTADGGLTVPAQMPLGLARAYGGWQTSTVSFGQTGSLPVSFSAEGTLREQTVQIQ